MSQPKKYSTLGITVINDPLVTPFNLTLMEAARKYNLRFESAEGPGVQYDNPTSFRYPITLRGNVSVRELSDFLGVEFENSVTNSIPGPNLAYSGTKVLNDGREIGLPLHLVMSNPTYTER